MTRMMMTDRSLHPMARPTAEDYKAGKLNRREYLATMAAFVGCCLLCWAPISNFLGHGPAMPWDPTVTGTVGKGRSERSSMTISTVSDGSSGQSSSFKLKR